ncbi:MAG: SGNH/GDSL hydrolase family protein [Gemmatimonadaceae bacterium]
MRSRPAPNWFAVAFVALGCAVGCARPGQERTGNGAPPVVVAQPKPLPDTARFAAELNAFARADSVTPPPPSPVLFVGSSSIRMWQSLATDFPGQPVLNRGFGGSRMDDLLRYADRVVFKYKPRTIVFYEGDNDLQDGRTPARIAGDAAEFLQRVRRTLPLTRVVCISVKPSPSRWNLIGQMRETNALLQAVVAQDTMATYVDVFTPMLGEGGRPRAELYVADSLHMTPAGYAIWTAAVRPVIGAGKR